MPARCVSLALLLLLAAAGTGTVHAKRRERRQAGGACVTSDGRPGSCVTIRSCPALDRLLQQAKLGGQGTSGVLNKLRQATFRCPFSVGSPLVCCETGGGGSASRQQGSRPQFNQQATRRPQFFTQRTTRRPQFVTQRTTRRPQFINQQATRRPQFVTQRTTRRPQFVTQRTTRRPQFFTQRTTRRPQFFTQRTTRRPQFVTQRTTRRSQFFTNPTRRTAQRPQSFSSASGQFSVALPGEDQCGRRTFSSRIIGGRDADIGSWPWAASVGYRVNGQRDLLWGCGATLITAQYVVTAGHCVAQASVGDNSPTVVRLGELDFNREPDCLRDNPSVCADRHKDIPIASLMPHSGYRGRGNNAFENDIALIRLSRSVRFTEFVRPICLPLDLGRLQSGSDSSNGQKVYAVGWGRSGNSGDNFTPKLQETVLRVAPRSDCERTYGPAGLRSLGSRLCATGADRGTDTCTGDSGGPLMVPDKSGTNWYLTGVTSFGSRRCGSQEAVYTRVHDYIAWIRSNLR